MWSKDHVKTIFHNVDYMSLFYSENIFVYTPTNVTSYSLQYASLDIDYSKSQPETQSTTLEITAVSTYMTEI